MAKKKKIDFTEIGKNVAGLAVGAVGGEVLDNKVLGKMKPMMRGIIKIGAGAALPVITGQSGFVESVGNGLVASGAISLAKHFMPGMVGASAPTEPESVDGIGSDYEDDGFIDDTDWQEISGMAEDDSSGGIFGTGDGQEAGGFLEADDPDDDLGL